MADQEKNGRLSGWSGNRPMGLREWGVLFGVVGTHARFERIEQLIDSLRKTE